MEEKPKSRIGYKVSEIAEMVGLDYRADAFKKILTSFIKAGYEPLGVGSIDPYGARTVYSVSVVEEIMTFGLSFTDYKKERYLLKRQIKELEAENLKLQNDIKSDLENISRKYDKKTEFSIVRG